MEPNNQTTIVETKSNGALIGSIIIIAILIIGGIYIWKTSVKEEAPDPNTTPDNTLDLEAEVNNLDLESLDSEI